MMLQGSTIRALVAGPLRITEGMSSPKLESIPALAPVYNVAEASATEALAAVDPVPFYVRYRENVWAGVKAHFDTVTDRAAAPIIAKYTGVLAAADIEIFTRTTTFAIMQSLRLDRGPSGPVHP
jgi:hypothetical protein